MAVLALAVGLAMAGVYTINPIALALAALWIAAGPGLAAEPASPVWQHGLIWRDSPLAASFPLVVDASDALLDEITARMPVDMLQLHGKESPARVAEIRARYGLPVMKAVGIAGEDDLATLESYFPVV